MDALKIKVRLAEKSALDDAAHKIFLRAIAAGAAKPTGAKQIDLQPGRMGVMIYVSKADSENITARAGRMTSMGGELIMPQEYVGKRIIAEYLHDNGPRSDQEIRALETMYGGRTLLTDTRQARNGREFWTVYVNPQEFGVLQLLARKAGEESVSDLVTNRIVPDFCRANPLGGDLGATAMKSIYGPTEAVKSHVARGNENPHGPLPIINPAMGR